MRTGRNLLALALAGGMCSVALAQDTDYVIVSDSPDETWIINGGGITGNFPVGNYDMAPAVRDTIRITSYNALDDGHEYEFDGTPTGTTYPTFGFAGQILDATQSADNNFCAEWSGNGAVYQFDPDWGSQTTLFSTGQSYTGIAYDSSDNSFWLSLDTTGVVEHRDLNGNLLGSFTIGSGRWACLAYEASSDTLWTVNNQGSEMRQYQKDGTLVTTQFVTGFGNVWGGDMPGGGTPRFRITVTGQCPGTITVAWANGNPNGAQQGLVLGQSQGQFTIPQNQPCGGTVLGIQGQVQLVDPPGIFSNQGGSGSISGRAGTSACGRYLQMVEGGSCITSNVRQIP